MKEPVSNETIIFDSERFNKELTMISQESVINVLRASQLHNKSIEYYQGLNYIVSFLYIMTRDESATFGLFIKVVERLSLDKLHSTSPSIKLKYYQMDRLVSLHLPRLAECFRRESIDSSRYVTSWLSTLFTNYLDCVRAPNAELEAFKQLLAALWDTFVAEGWKAVFKAGLYLLKRFEKEVLSVEPEDVVCTLTGINKKKVWCQVGSLKNLKFELSRIKVTNSMLEALEVEFNSISSQV